MTEQISVTDVRYVKELYPRLKPNDEVVERYRDALENLPPIVVARDGVLVDGYHRWQAHVREGAESIEAENLGDLSDAEILRESITRNATHGQQMSRQDKQRMAARLWSAFADVKTAERVKDIAALLAVSDRAVQAWTKDARKAEKEQQQDRVLDLWLDCADQKVIADVVGISQPTVSEWLIEKRKSADFDTPPDSRQHFDVWQFPTTDRESGGQQSYFGAVPPQVIENLLWFYTEPGHTVVDFFAGSGTTVDVAKRMGRRVWASDIRGDHYSPHLPIHQHDITTGWPAAAPKTVEMVFLDPPYWQQAAGKYSTEPNELGEMDLDTFYDAWSRITKTCIERADRVAYIISPTQNEDGLRRVDTPVRWMSDIIAVRPYPESRFLVFVDAKAGKKYLETGNHDIEISALESAERWLAFAGENCRYYFVFSDGGVIKPDRIREIGELGNYRGNGSGTPFLIFPADACTPFDGVFGPVIPDHLSGGD